ncbi:MAG: hypothetical protein QNJ46_34570 [Leptolyngbyaceae cyanobacterium MO_188.B28]|nr:hypothetical protein [Leptolyngbyaceae cyanobacterium MO_188.B28]
MKDCENNSARLLRLLNDSDISASTNASGDGGRVIINNPQGTLLVERDSSINSNSGDLVGAITQSGGIEITTDRLVVQDKGDIRTNTRGSIPGGSITIVAREIEIVGEVSASASETATGNGGTLEIEADSITVDRGFIGSESGVMATGDAGAITIRTRELFIENGGSISATALNDGDAGNLTITGEKVELVGRGEKEELAVSSDNGIAGNLTLNAGLLRLENNATITVNSDSNQAGILEINAGSVSLNNSAFEAISSRGENSGNITVNISGALLRLENQSRITAEAREGANGGNVTLNAPNGFILARPSGNSDILANAEFGRGGNIDVQTNAIFGLEERDPLTDFSDFNASSEFNTDGEIVLATLGIDPSRGLSELPIDVVDVAGLVATGCLGGNRSGVEDQGEYTVTDRGGIAQSPTDLLFPEGGVANLATLDNDGNLSDAAAVTAVEMDQPLEEAQGLAFNADGQVVIVSHTSAATSDRSALPATHCREL